MVGFLYGGSTGETPESLKRKRELIEQMIMGQRTPQNAGEGWGAVLKGLAANIQNRRLDKAEAAGQQSANSVMDRITGLIEGTNPDIFGGGSTAGNIPMTGAASELAGTGTTPKAGGADSPIYADFMGTVKEGGLTNPYGLAAVASTGNAESGWSAENANRRWSDPSQSGQAGTAGGAMSWRNDRLANLEAYAKMAGEDPRNISAKTQAKFFLQEDPNLIAALNKAGSVGEAQTLMNNAWKFAGYNQPSKEAANRLSAANAYLPQFQGNGGGATGEGGGADYISYANQGATRNRPLSDKLVASLGFLPELGVTAEVFSGGQPSAEEGGARTGSTRHDHGNAADVHFMKDGRRLDWANPKDRPIFEEIVRRGKAAGITGFGAGDGYMQPGSMHLGFGDAAVWGAGGKGDNAPGWLRSAYNGTGEQPNGAVGSAADAVTAMANGGRQPQNVAVDSSPQQFFGSQQLASAQGGMMPALMGGRPATAGQVAQAQARGQQTMTDAGGGPSLQQLYEAAANPWLSREQRAIVGQLLEQKLQDQQSVRQEQQWRARADYEQRLKMQDPAYTLGLEKTRADIDAAKRRGTNLINAGNGSIYDPVKDKWMSAPTDENTGGPFRYKGNSVEAQALNGLMDANVLTPEQAQQLGAGKTISGPNGEIIFLTPQGVFGSQPGGQPQKLSGGAQETSGGQAGVGGGNLQITEPKVTIDERKAMGFADRMAESGALINEFGDSGLNGWNQFVRGNNWIPDFAENWMISKDFQNFDQARRNFINAQLRRESGAVISPEEFDNANKQYLPEPGDGKDVLKQKADNRRTVINAMARDAGPTYNASRTNALAEARAAIAKGADPEAVKQRLRENNIDPEGL